MNKLKNKRIGVLIVLYNKDLNESLTLNSLLKQESSIDKLIIWNNGPLDIYDTKKLLDGTKADLINSQENKSLSEIYNWFLSELLMDKYFIFDDDTSVSNNLAEIAEDNDSDLIIPQVIDNGKFCYPINYSGKLIEQGYSPKEILSIGSGLCLDKKLVNKLKAKYNTIFDERFRFYGVDTTFFFRVSALHDINIYTLGTIQHSLSKNISESKGVSRFRRQERAKDLALQVRYYFKFISLKSAIGFLLRSVKNRSLVDITTFFKYLTLGPHKK